MDALPVELMEIIFKELNQMEDVQKCFHTCIFWNKIIANMYRENCKYYQTFFLHTVSIFKFFLFLAKILVAAEINDCKTSIEIIDLLDPQSKYAFVDKRAEKFNIRPYFGGVLQNRPFLLLNFYGSTKAKAKALHIKNKTHILQLLCDNERRKQNDVGVILNDDTCWSINETPPRCANYCL